jgi:hypothetical protein
MKRSTLVVSLLVACSPAIALGDGDSRTVDCARGQSIAEALEKKNPDRPLTVVVRGTCMEGVVISRDDVSLVGDGGSINGSVTVAGAQRVVIADLSITNPGGDGVTVTDNASVTIRGNQINDSSGYGIFVRNGSFANVNDNEMMRNGVVNTTNIDASGIAVGVGSTVRGRGNRMAENINTGIEVFDNSTYRGEGDTIAMRISAGRSAVDTYRSGYVDLRSVTVNGTMLVNQQSQLQVRVVDAPSVITGNINVSQLSFLRLRAGVQRVNSTLGCNSGPNSFAVCQCDGFPGNVCPISLP